MNFRFSGRDVAGPGVTASPPGPAWWRKIMFKIITGVVVVGVALAVVFLAAVFIVIACYDRNSDPNDYWMDP